ncbi:MAG: riboflavin synthase [Saprospiraceae bacterium]|nr:riboflavin synthase [Saprospiraceae bacterium]
MFTGIIEALGKVEKIEREGSNVHFTFSSPISDELKIDQSVAHNGVCLTVVALPPQQHTLTAIQETLDKSNLGRLQEGDEVNLERAMVAGSRLDGHMVQGHVDTTGLCTKVEALDGSWYYHFEYEPTPEHLLVDKGSICINGVSLTVVQAKGEHFSVAIIPYTYEHTTFKDLQAGDRVNLEFDVIGKYIAKYMAVYGEGAEAALLKS